MIKIKDAVEGVIVADGAFCREIDGAFCRRNQE